MIDVSDIINDPDFVQDFSIVSVTFSMTEGAENTTESAPVAQRGIVLPAKVDALQVLPEGQRRNETVAIYANVELQLGDGLTRKPDLVIYTGKYYLVAYTKWYAQCNVWYALAQRVQRVQP